MPRPPDTTGASRDAAAPLTLGTAGHIDHGKTALITLLTGKNTDRLREEQERGISIELGYAELELPGGGRLSVVDVPGHERFVRTMVAGATGIDLFLLVIAADDGVMPQTLEHVAIIELLGVERGVVALTKADLVDEELLEMAVEDVREFLAQTPYSGCEVVIVSARDGRGTAELRAALQRAVEHVTARRRGGPARLPVDRVFPLKGIGTVVTGTLWRGEIRAGDALVVEPGGTRTAVRSVQVHDHEAEVVRAGSRVGVNLRGLDRDAVSRGRWLVAPEAAGRVCRRFDAWLQVVPGGRPLRSGDQVRLHHGTAQYLARVAPLEGREIAAGAQAAAARCSSQARVAGTTAGGTPPFSPRCAPPTCAPPPSPWRPTALRVGSSPRIWPPPGSAPARPAPRWRRPRRPASSRLCGRRPWPPGGTPCRSAGSAPALWPRCARSSWPAPRSGPPRVPRAPSRAPPSLRP